MLRAGLQIFKSVFCVAALVAFPAVSHATNEDDARDRFHAAISECASQLNLPAPQPGAKPPKLSDEQREDLDSCLAKQGVQPPGPPPGGFRDPKFHEQMHACLKATGIDVPRPQPGSPPPALSDEQKAALDKCHAQIEGAQLSNDQQ